MKRIVKNQECKVYYCHAFREDLQHVIDMMTVDGTLPELTSGGWEFADANELFGFLGEKGNPEILITSRKRCVRVSTLRYLDHVRISTTDDSDSSIALLHHVADALKGCAKKRPFLSYPWARSIAPALGGLVAIGLSVAWFTQQKWVLFPCLAASFVGLLLALFQLRYGNQAANCFYGVLRNTRKSFLQRKGDDLIVSLVAVVFGTVLGVAGTLLIQATASTSPPPPGVQSKSPVGQTRPNSG